MPMIFNRLASSFTILLIGLNICFYISASDTSIDMQNNLNSASAGSVDIFKNISPLVFQIKTSNSADSPKTSYGSAFVVGNEGLLLTNYHVISSIINDENNNYKAYLVDGDKNIEVTIIDFNIIYDMALVKVNKFFDQSLVLNTSEVPIGSEIYSIGLPQDLRMAIVSGIYNGLVTDGLYSKCFMTTPINSGMSGGPTVDKEGRVIGINVSYLIGSQNITFSVPISYAIELIEKNKVKTKDQQLDLKNSYVLISDQLHNVQASLMEDILSSKEERADLSKWQIAKIPKTLKCWTKNDPGKDQNYKSTKQLCFLNNAAFLDENSYSGSYEISYEVIDNIKLNKFQFYSAVSSKLNKLSILENIFLVASNTNNLSKYSCNSSVFVNKQGLSFKINYCLAAYNKYKDIYDLKFNSVTLENKGSFLITKGSFNGISKDNIYVFLKHLFSNIAYKEETSN